MKDKKYTDMRSWVSNNLDGDQTQLFRSFYDNSIEYLEPDSIPQFVILAGDYQFKHAFVANPEINAVAFFTDIMLQCRFK